MPYCILANWLIGTFILGVLAFFVLLGADCLLE